LRSKTEGECGSILFLFCGFLPFLFIPKPIKFPQKQIIFSFFAKGIDILFLFAIMGVILAKAESDS